MVVGVWTVLWDLALTSLASHDFNFSCASAVQRCEKVISSIELAGGAYYG